jgi:glycosyltransferase involved in cell wall biosynthesis
VRIGFVTPHYAPFIGGVETHVGEIAASLAAMGLDIEVLTQESDRSLPAVEMMRGVRVRRFVVPVASKNYAFSPTLAVYLARHRQAYDIVHAHNYHSLPALVAAVAGCTPLMFTPHYHGTSESQFRRALHVPYRQIARVLVARSQRVICVSERERALFTRDFPSAAARIVVISNGVDISRVRKAKPFGVGGKVLVSAGRLARYKHVERTIEALACLDDAFVLRVIGEGEARPELEAEAARLGVDHRVAFLGHVDTDTLYRWFRTAVAFVSMSAIEAMPVTPLEALAAGARVVASDIPAHRELSRVTNGDVTLVPANAPANELANTIEGVAARPAAAADVLSWNDVAQRTLDVYRAAVSTT